MLSNLNPLAVLLLGAIIGWLLEWFFDLWFFRRNRLEAERRLEAAEAQRATWEARARASESRITDLEQQLSQSTAALAVAEAARQADGSDAESPPDVIAEPEVESEPVPEDVEVVAIEETAVVEEVEVVDEAEFADTETESDAGVAVEEAAEEASPVPEDAWPPGSEPEAEAESEVMVIDEVATYEAVAVTDEIETVEPEAEEVELEAGPAAVDAWPPGEEPEAVVETEVVEAEVVEESAPAESASWEQEAAPEALAVEGEVIAVEEEALVDEAESDETGQEPVTEAAVEEGDVVAVEVESETHPASGNGVDAAPVDADVWPPAEPGAGTGSSAGEAAEEK